jgi:hypothetical protein
MFDRFCVKWVGSAWLPKIIWTCCHCFPFTSPVSSRSHLVRSMSAVVGTDQTPPLLQPEWNEMMAAETRDTVHIFLFFTVPNVQYWSHRMYKNGRIRAHMEGFSVGWWGWGNRRRKCKAKRAGAHTTQFLSRSLDLTFRHWIHTHIYSLYIFTVDWNNYTSVERTTPSPQL